MYSPVKVFITDEMYQSALSRDCGQMNKNSFMKGKGNIVGFLGEEMVKSLSSDFILADNYDYDFLFNGYSIDVKNKETERFTYSKSGIQPRPKAKRRFG